MFVVNLFMIFCFSLISIGVLNISGVMVIMWMFCFVKFCVMGSESFMILFFEVV